MTEPSYQVTAGAGDLIFDQGDPGTDMYLIRQGEVEIVRRGEAGDETIVATLGQGEFFGEIGILLDGHPRTAAARAKKDCRLLRANLEMFEELIRGDSSIAIRILRRLALRLRDASVDVDVQIEEEGA